MNLQFLASIRILPILLIGLTSAQDEVSQVGVNPFINMLIPHNYLVTFFPVQLRRTCQMLHKHFGRMGMDTLRTERKRRHYYTGSM